MFSAFLGAKKHFFQKVLKKWSSTFFFEAFPNELDGIRAFLAKAGFLLILLCVTLPIEIENCFYSLLQIFSNSKSHRNEFVMFINGLLSAGEQFWKHLIH